MSNKICKCIPLPKKMQLFFPNTVILNGKAWAECPSPNLS